MHCFYVALLILLSAHSTLSQGESLHEKIFSTFKISHFQAVVSAGSTNAHAIVIEESQTATVEATPTFATETSQTASVEVSKDFATDISQTVATEKLQTVAEETSQTVVEETSPVVAEETSQTVVANASSGVFCLSRNRGSNGFAFGGTAGK